jgi:hypothetical protein
MIRAATDNTGDTTPPLLNSPGHVIDLCLSYWSGAGNGP